MGAVGVLVGAVASIVLAVAISRVVKRRDRAEAAEVENAEAPRASA